MVPVIRRLQPTGHSQSRHPKGSKLLCCPSALVLLTRNPAVKFRPPSSVRPRSNSNTVHAARYADIYAITIEENATANPIFCTRPFNRFYASSRTTHLGIEMLGSITTKLISRNTTTPTKKLQTFTTAAGNWSLVKVNYIRLSPQDPYYGHEQTAKMCVRYVNNLFHCPDQPPPSSTPTPPPSLAHFIAYALHHTRLTSSVTFATLYLLQRLKTWFIASISQSTRNCAGRYLAHPPRNLGTRSLRSHRNDSRSPRRVTGTLVHRLFPRPRPLCRLHGLLVE